MRLFQLHIAGLLLLIFTTTMAFAAVSPDGTFLFAPSSGSLMTSAGTWTFDSYQGSPGNYQILLNGQASNGYASEMEVANGGRLYALASSQWYLWNGGWMYSGPPPAPVTASCPAPAGSLPVVCHFSGPQIIPPWNNMTVIVDSGPATVNMLPCPMYLAVKDGYGDSLAAPITIQAPVGAMIDSKWSSFTLDPSTPEHWHGVGFFCDQAGGIWVQGN